METIRIAVIGVGYLGRFHAEKYAALPGVELVAVVDSDPATARRVGSALSVPWELDFRAVLPRVDAVSVVVPASAHHAITRECLLAGVDVLVEKPIALTVAEADEMIRLACQQGRLLQVGHLERYNPVAQALRRQIEDPRFIEGNRLAPYKGRATDTDVLLDLMIHDLDLLLHLVGQPIEHIEACGAPVLTEQLDIANARIRFANGAVANLTASRVSLKTERKLRFFQKSGYVSADFGSRRVTCVNVDRSTQPPTVVPSEQAFEGDGLRDELSAFVDAVRTRRLPDVPGEDGRAALAAALAVRQAIESNPLIPG